MGISGERLAAPKAARTNSLLSNAGDFLDADAKDDD
jgi:hypothetical protein